MLLVLGLAAAGAPTDVVGFAPSFIPENNKLPDEPVPAEDGATAATEIFVVGWGCGAAAGAISLTNANADPDGAADAVLAAPPEMVSSAKSNKLSL